SRTGSRAPSSCSAPPTSPSPACTTSRSRRSPGGGSGGSPEPICRRAGRAGPDVDVLVTGGAGYVGSFVWWLLRSRGDCAVGREDVSEGHRRAVGKTDLVVGDIVDPEAVDRALSTADVRAVVHMAASALVGESMRDPAAYFENNVVKSI